ncbi:hypothetical protein LXL04_027704 [Taraxacum kok-saghyz]
MLCGTAEHALRNGRIFCEMGPCNYENAISGVLTDFAEGTLCEMDFSLRNGGLFREFTFGNQQIFRQSSGKVFFQMDRDTWMYGLKRDDDEYIVNLKDFLKVAENNRVTKGENHIWCPCKLCQNCKMLYEVNKVEEHLIVNGFMHGYTRWSRHGELLIDRNMVDIECNDDDQTDYFEDDNNNKLDDMLHDIEDDVPDKDHLKFQQLFDDAEKPLYATHGWSDKSFTDTLETLHEMLPDDNEVPVSTYQAKKLLCPMGLEVERIDACPNDCMLYRDKYADLDKCVTCGTSRYKKKNETEVNNNVKKNAPAAKVLKYFPIIPRLKRLFANTKNAKLLRWHAEDRKKDGKIRHVADSPQWRNIDYEFKEFGDEIRNIRFGLSSDGINPFGNMSTHHSTWPVLLCIYNLPPWLCMKRKYIMMSLLIQGPRQPGNDIDVYLAPLIEDLKILWNSGVDVYDATKGKKACPICENDTRSLWLENGKKVVYMGHRRSLPISHEYRQMGNLFDATIEKDKGAHPMNGRTSFSRFQNLNIVFGKSSKSGQIDNWKKRSIFWELPYWEKLDVRHCLDVMQIEKNVCESLIGLLLNIKSKDSLNVRKDMVKMGIRPELAPIEKDKKNAPIYHQLVPSRYSANIKRLVSMKDLKLLGMKSHDYHVLIMHMIPIAIRGILPDHIRHTITKLCLFFNMINSKVIDPEILDSWQSDIIMTLCQLEMYFPPSFFDVMVHLISHIVREIKICGPVFLHL